MRRLRVLGTYIQSLDSFVEAGLDALGHETAPAAAAKVVLNALFPEAVLLQRPTLAHIARSFDAWLAQVHLVVSVEGASEYLDKLVLQANSFKLYAIILHIDIEVAVARADGTIALHNPAFVVMEWG